MTEERYKKKLLSHLGVRCGRAFCWGVLHTRVPAGAVGCVDVHANGLVRRWIVNPQSRAVYQLLHRLVTPLRRQQSWYRRQKP